MAIMMNIPRLISISSISQQPKHFTGQIAFDQFPRFTEALLSSEGELVCELRCTRSKIDCTLDAEVELICQRCLQPYRQPIHSQTQFVVISDIDKLNDLNSEEEPVIIEEGNIPVFNMIEDELLLLLPNIPMHPEDECSVVLESLTPKPSQFDILASLKN